MAGRGRGPASVGCVICSERERKRGQGEGGDAGGAPWWPRGPRQGEALAGEVAKEGGTGDINPSEGIGVVKVVQRGGGGTGKSWRRSRGWGAGRARLLGATWCVSAGQTVCAGQMSPGPGRRWKEGKEDQIK